jgi:hypothetical protein
MKHPYHDYSWSRITGRVAEELLRSVRGKKVTFS